MVFSNIEHWNNITKWLYQKQVSVQDLIFSPFTTKAGVAVGVGVGVGVGTGMSVSAAVQQWAENRPVSRCLWKTRRKYILAENRPVSWCLWKTRRKYILAENRPVCRCLKDKEEAHSGWKQTSFQVSVKDKEEAHSGWAQTSFQVSVKNKGEAHLGWEQTSFQVSAKDKKEVHSGWEQTSFQVSAKDKEEAHSLRVSRRAFRSLRTEFAPCWTLSQLWRPCAHLSDTDSLVTRHLTCCLWCPLWRSRSGQGEWWTCCPRCRSWPRTETDLFYSTAYMPPGTVSLCCQRSSCHTQK